VSFVSARSVIWVNLTFSTTFLLLEVSGRVAVFCMEISTLVLVFTRPSCNWDKLLTTNTDGLSSYAITKVVVSLVSTRSVVRVHLTFFTTFLLLKISCRVAIFGMEVSTLVLILTGTSSPNDFFVTADTNWQSLNVVTEVVMSFVSARSVVRVHLTFFTTFLLLKISGRVAIFGMEISTLVLVLSGASCNWDRLLTTNTDGLSSYAITKVVVSLVSTRSVVRIYLSFFTTFLLLKISGRVAIFGMKISTLVLVLSGASSIWDRLLTTNTDGLSSYAITKVVMSFVSSRSVVRINLSFFTTFLLLKVSGRVAILGMEVSTLVLVLSGTRSPDDFFVTADANW